MSWDSDYGPYTGAWGDPRNEDGVYECPDCNGTGLAGNDSEEECPYCKGLGGIDADGEPAKLEEA